jgi:hypothetical protein
MEKRIAFAPSLAIKWKWRPASWLFENSGGTTRKAGRSCVVLDPLPLLADAFDHTSGSEPAICRIDMGGRLG